MSIHRVHRSSARRRVLAGLAAAAVLLPVAALATGELSSSPLSADTDVEEDGRSKRATTSAAPRRSTETHPPVSTTDASIGTATTAPSSPLPESVAPGSGSPSEAAVPEEPVAIPAAPPTAEPPAARAVGGTAIVPPGTWLSGAAGTGVATGEFAAWRDSPVTIAGTWADNNVAQIELWSLDPGQELGAWTQSIDIAIGAIGPDESWAAAATGAYDARWQQSLVNLRAAWGSRPGTVFLRFAHEMNSDWYPWSVSAGEQRDFIAAWGRFRALQQRIFPDAQLVFCVNRESVGTGMDWRVTFPGADQVDVMGVDYYNQYPYTGSAADWAASLRQTDGYGAPKGLQAHLDFARSVGLPLAVPEWSGKASQGDSPAFIQGMHDFFAANAGGGAGQLLYEVQFNVDMHGDDYRMFGGGRLPESAARYRELF